MESAEIYVIFLENANDGNKQQGWGFCIQFTSNGRIVMSLFKLKNNIKCWSFELTAECFFFFKRFSSGRQQCSEIQIKK